MVVAADGPPPQADVVDLAVGQEVFARGPVGLQKFLLVVNAVEVTFAKRPEPLDGVALWRPLIYHTGRDVRELRRGRRGIRRDTERRTGHL